MNSNTRVRAQAESTTDNIEAGIVALFSSRVMSLVTTWNTWDIVLACSTIFGLQKLILGGQINSSKPMHVLASVLKGIVLKIVLNAIISKDNLVYIAHLLCLFFVMHAFNAEEICTSTKYIFATHIAQVLDADAFMGMTLFMVLQANIGILSSLPRLQECAQLVVVQLGVQWFQENIPKGMELATTLLFMHMTFPFVEDKRQKFLLTDLYTVALYQVSSSIQLPGADRLVQAVYAGLLWSMSRDQVSTLIGQFSCVQIATQIVMDAGTAILRTDPILAVWFILTGFGVVISLTF